MTDITQWAPALLYAALLWIAAANLVAWRRTPVTDELAFSPDGTLLVRSTESGVKHWKVQP